MRHTTLIDLPASAQRAAPRYTTTALPPYRYVPGLQPHPLRDPGGHSFNPQAALARHPRWEPNDWPQLEPWLYGIDLFNAFYFWEAHEAWEELWASAERGSAPFLLLQGLIQIAAALLKTHLAVVDGARRLSAEGLDKLRRAGQGHVSLLGLEIEPTARSFAAYFAPLARGALPPIDDSVPVLRLLRVT